MPSGRPVLVLATKSDKLNQSEQARAAANIRARIVEKFPAQAMSVTVLPFSATRRMGVADADAVLAGWLGL